MTVAVRPLLAPHGVLRVGINLANPLLVSRDSAEGVLIGLAPTLAATIAGRLGVEVEFVTYPSAGRLVDDSLADRWDLAFIAADPARAATLAFSIPYALIEARFLVHAASEYASGADVDRPGVRIVAHARSAYALWLEAHLRAASLVSVADDAEAIGEFETDRDAVVAGLTPALSQMSTEVADGRMLPGSFMAVRQAIAVPRSREAASTALSRIVREYRQSGVLAALIGRSSLGEFLLLPDSSADG